MVGRLDVLVNDIWGGEKLFEWNKPVWDHNLDNGLRLIRLHVDTHLITAHFALPLMIEHPGGLLVEVGHRCLTPCGRVVNARCLTTINTVDAIPHTNARAD